MSAIFLTAGGQAWSSIQDQPVRRPAVFPAVRHARRQRRFVVSVAATSIFKIGCVLGVPSTIFSTQSVRPDFSRVSRKRCHCCVLALDRRTTVHSPRRGQRTVYAVFMPYAAAS